MLRDEDVHNVRSSVTMRQIAEMYGYKVTRSGFISCPFHGEDKHPSMKVYDGDRGYNCFVCHRGGDIINFVKEHDGLDFEPAVRLIANYFGIPVSDGEKKLSQADRERIQKRKAEREAKQREEKERQQRLTYLSERLRILEAIQSRCEPLSYVWCGAEQNKVKHQHEWEELFNAIDF